MPRAGKPSERPARAGGGRAGAKFHREGERATERRHPREASSGRACGEGIDLTTDDFYVRLGRGEQPITSQPAPGEFVRAYQAALARFKTVVSIHVTGKASGTVQAAGLARRSLPAADIEVVDSGLTSMALGFVVLEAARAAVTGCSKDEVLRAIADAKARVFPYIAVPTLTYLRRSGRVGAGMAVLGSLLNIKPILTMKDGLVTAVDRVRTYPKALARVTELLEETSRGRKVRLAVVYSKVHDEACRFAELERRLHVEDEPIVTEIGAALAVHGGPGMLGAVIYRRGK